MKRSDLVKDLLVKDGYEGNDPKILDYVSRFIVRYWEESDLEDALSREDGEDLVLDLKELIWSLDEPAQGQVLKYLEQFFGDID